ncbi:hypothetical protein ACEWY4_019368 [Coilia grayii]|uniref:Ig-like domain-containing protein n=1 Tax=Coilia grayii TaxID=363190 RepID=A0ABD1JC04_9TELE
MDMSPLLGGLVLTLLQLHTGDGHVLVKPEVSAYFGDDVILPCRYSSSDAPSNVTQVQWFRKQQSADHIIIVYHTIYGLDITNTTLSGRLKFSSGGSPVEDASILIAPVRPADQGEYICEFITFPAGNLRATTTLTLTEARAETGPLSKGHTAAVAMATILAVLLLATVVFVISARRRNNIIRHINNDRNPPPPLTQTEDVTYADVTFQRPPVIGPDATLDYMTVTPNNQLGSAPPSSRGSDCDWPPCPEVETVYSAVKLQPRDRSTGCDQRF